MRLHFFTRPKVSTRNEGVASNQSKEAGLSEYLTKSVHFDTLPANVNMVT